MSNPSPRPTRADRRRPTYPRWVVGLMALAAVLHLNYWLWDSDRLVLGLPVNLLYHVVLTLALAGIMLFLVRAGWPRFLDDEDSE